MWYIDMYDYNGVTPQREKANKEFPCDSYGPMSFDEALECVSKLNFPMCGIDEIRIVRETRDTP